MSTAIEDIMPRKVFNNRGDETIEIDVITTSGFGRASAPAGKSLGKGEVQYYPAGGVDEAVKKVEELVAPELVGQNADFQDEIDKTLHEIDGTKDFKVIGGNTAFAISLATAEAAANSCGYLLFQYLGGQLAHELPFPLGNTISGGKHAREGKSPDIQEFLSFPVGAESFLESATANIKVHQRAGKLLEKRDKTFSKGRSDEGAWLANIGNIEALETISKAGEEVANELGIECGLGIDFAASSLWNPETEKYLYKREGKQLNSGEQLEYAAELIKKYHLYYVEDPFHEEDFKNFAELSGKVKNCLICGDDLFVTSSERLARGIKAHAGNSVIIKVNQVGTLTDAWETIEMAEKAGYVPVLSHRSGDTCDWHIAQLAVAFKCPIIKTGVVEGARVAKINELIRVEEFLGDKAKMADMQLI